MVDSSGNQTEITAFDTSKIKSVIETLQQDKDFSNYSGSNEVLRKTRLANRATGQYEDFYITRSKKGVAIENSQGKNFGSVQLINGKDSNLQFYGYQSSSYHDRRFIELDYLTTNNKGAAASQYKGLGTELVKQAIIESYKQGNDGRIALNAAELMGHGSPRGFYDKVGLYTKSALSQSGLYISPEHTIPDILAK